MPISMSRKIALMLDMNLRDQLLRRDAFGLRLEHDGCAVRVIGADVVALMAAQLLKSDPDVGLNGFEDVAQVQRPIGVGQSAGDKDSAALGHAKLCHDRRA